ncbi:hypothetical protein [Mesorhizobium sp. M0306]|uniref:hypothetical protein n=1 Tax=unclassified Mesorhizobium TaxID=325217 RepID=UPI00333BE639
MTKLLSGRSRTYRPGFFARLFPAGKWKLTLDPKLSGHFRLAQDSEVELSRHTELAILMDHRY